MVFANVLIEGWIVYPNVYSFFDQPNVVVEHNQFANVLIEGWIVYPNVYSFFDQPNVVVEHNYIRLIKEAIYIRVNNPSLNKNIGKYHLPHVWDEVLDNITELKLK